MNEQPIRAPRRTPWSSMLALATGAFVFLGFVGYGLLAPTTYRATAQIVLKPLGDKPLSLPTSPPASERLRQAALSQESLDRVASQLELQGGTDSHGSARRALETQLEVVSSSATTFDVSFKSPGAAAAQLNATVLAKQAASQALQVLVSEDRDPTAAREAARAKAAADLARFMARHPELTAGPVVAPVAPKPGAEVDLSSLRAERDQLQAKVARFSESTASSDNPFGDAPAANPEATRLRRRIAEIDLTLARARKTETKPDPTPKVPPEVDREWKKLLHDVAEPSVPEVAQAQAPFAVLLREATLPPRPISPDRRLVGIAGVLTSLVSAILVLVVQASRRRRAEYNARYAQTAYAGGGRPTSDWPQRPPSDPPQAGSDWPPRMGGSEPPLLGPRPGSDPPRPGSDPPRPGSDPPRPGSDPPYPIVNVGAEPLRGAPVTAVGHAIPSPPPAAGPPSPPPPATEPHATAPDVLPRVPAAARVPKGTLVGIAPIDPRALDEAEAAAAARIDDAPRATLRPPPEVPVTVVEATGVIVSGPGIAAAADPAAPPAAPAPQGRSSPPAPAEEEDWTGPSRAHRRSSARRTTQTLGSVIAPVVRRRSDAPPPADTSSAPPPAGRHSPTGYSYVSEVPAAPAPRTADTPPYYQMPKAEGARFRQHPPSTPAPMAAVVARPAPERAHINKHSTRQGWSPHPSVDPLARRPLADQIFPLAVESCFVVGITAVPESRGMKARVAAELALALSEPRHPRILLLEADFQWPTVHEIMRIDMPMSMGFSQQLRSRQAQPNTWTVVTCNPTLHVLGEGIMRSPGLILSVQFEEGLRSLRTYYDIIVVHGPDASSEVECRALASVVDGYVLLAPPSGSRDIARLAEQFQNPRFSTVVGV